MAGTWFFRRDGQRLEMQRIVREQGAGLRITDTHGSREQWFDDLSDLVAAQGSMERHLTTLGWALVDYLPERRAGHERRRSPRDTPDRRGLTLIGVSKI